MNHFTKYSEKDKSQDYAIIVFGIIQAIYISREINRPTFNAIEKRFGEDIVNGVLSPTFYAEERARLQKGTVQPLESLSDLEQMFIRVENGELMVTEACEQLKIGRFTYYRQYRKWKETRIRTMRNRLFGERVVF